MEGADRNAIYDRAYEWLGKRMEANGNNSRISYTKKEEGQIVAQGEEYLVFSSNAFSLDRALMDYNLVVLCGPGRCEVSMERIRYNYEDNRYTAEEQISDEAALNKKKTGIYRGNKKFRVATVDYVEDLFESVKMAFGIRDATSVAPLVTSRPQQATTVTPVTESASSASTETPAPADAPSVHIPAASVSSGAPASFHSRPYKLHAHRRGGERIYHRLHIATFGRPQPQMGFGVVGKDWDSGNIVRKDSASGSGYRHDAEWR